MAYFGLAYTNGVIAVREKYLLKDKIYRLCESSATDAFRSLTDTGFGGGAETTTSVYEFEKLVAVEESRLDAFIREYAPSETESAYLLAPRDFHNAKAFVKASYLGENPEKMLAPEGRIPVGILRDCVLGKDYSALETVCPDLVAVCKEAQTLLAETPDGAKLGVLFDRACYRYLLAVVGRKKTLKRLLMEKADMTNILTAFRTESVEEFAEYYIPAGNLDMETLSKLYQADTQTAFVKTPYAEIVRLCNEAKEKGLPYTQAERIRDSHDERYFSARKYELSKNEPFLYYVYRKKAEIQNVRIVFVCLLAGLEEGEIKRRLRSV